MNDIQLQIPSIQSSTVVSSAYNIAEMTTSNSSPAIMTTPLTAVGDVSDFVNSNPFNPTSNYVNSLISSSSDVITDSPLNGQSSTFRAFFMSEMERLGTVKTITGITDLA